MCQIDPIFPKFWPFLGPQTPLKPGKKREKCQIDPILPPHLYALPEPFGCFQVVLVVIESERIGTSPVIMI